MICFSQKVPFWSLSPVGDSAGSHGDYALTGSGYMVLEPKASCYSHSKTLESIQGDRLLEETGTTHIGPSGISVGAGTIAGEKNPQQCKTKSSINIFLDLHPLGPSRMSNWTSQKKKSK
jgi:hypothetical protein